MSAESHQVAGAGKRLACVVGSTFMLGLWFVGCSEKAQSERVFWEVQFDTAFVFGSPEDSVLLRPGALRPWRDGVVVFDAETFRVAAFDGEGKLQWIFHQPGSGPTEVMNPLDGFARRDGTVLLLDAGNQRLVALTPEGRFGSLILSRGTLPFQTLRVAPVASSQVLLLGFGMRGAFLDLESLEPVGDLDLELSAPVPPGFRSDLTVAADPQSGVWALGMRFGPDWWVGGPGGSLRCVP